MRKGPSDEGIWSSVCCRRLVYGEEMGDRVATATAEGGAAGAREPLEVACTLLGSGEESEKVGG